MQAMAEREAPRQLSAATGAAMMLCKPHPEPVLRMASNFHG